MSIHKSLRKIGALQRHRNVLTRAERFKSLEEEGKASDATSVYGLPKLRSILIKAKPKAKAEPAAAAAGATPVAGAPAAGAAPAAGGKAGAAAPAAGAKGAPAAGAKAAAPAKK